MAVLCDDCIRLVGNNLSPNELMLLQAMQKNKVINVHQSMDKVKLIPLVKGLSIYKMNFAVERLLAIGAITKSTVEATNKFYINENGIRIIKVLSEDMMK